MLLEKPLVSIVMAAYNEEEFIKEAIDSILTQSYPNFEFIIVNDGSTDRTEEIILSFSDPRIKYIKNEVNLKLIASLNKGLSMAKGKYIARMDSDDISLPKRIEKQVEFMESHPEIGISGAQLIVFGSQKTTMNYPLENDELLLRLMVTSCFPNNLVIFRKKLLEQHKLEFPVGYIHAEDYKFWTKWLQITKGANLCDYLVKYRFHARSVSNAHKDVQRKTRNIVRQEYIVEMFKLTSDEKKIAADLYQTNYKRKIKAVIYFLKRNKELNLFDQQKLEQTLFYLWYADSLENIRNDRLTVFNFTKIFTLSFTKNLRYWEYVMKATIKWYLGSYNE